MDVSDLRTRFGALFVYPLMTDSIHLLMTNQLLADDLELCVVSSELLFVDLFDTIATLIAVTVEGGLAKKDSRGVSSCISY